MGNKVPEGQCIGYGIERDRSRHIVSDTGIVGVTRKSLDFPLGT